MSGDICSQMSGPDLDGNLVKVKCIEHECRHYIAMSGTNRMTGQPVDKWGCAFEWQPILTVESTAEIKIAAAEMKEAKDAIRYFHETMALQNNALLETRDKKKHLV